LQQGGLAKIEELVELTDSGLCTSTLQILKGKAAYGSCSRKNTPAAIESTANTISLLQKSCARVAASLVGSTANQLLRAWLRRDPGLSMPTKSTCSLCSTH
jgi:hypothetical protein